MTLEIQKIVKRRDLFTSNLKLLEDDTRYSNLEQIGTTIHSSKTVLLIMWPKITDPLPPLGFHWSWCVVASSDIGNGTHFALIPLSHSLDAPQDPWLLFSYFLPQLTNWDGFHLHILDIPFIYQFYSRVTTLVESTG